MTIQYQHDYRPGWTYLNGQKKPRQVIEARNAADAAWLAYETSIDETTGVGDQVLLIKARRLEDIAILRSANWNRYFLERTK